MRKRNQKSDTGIMDEESGDQEIQGIEQKNGRTSKEEQKKSCSCLEEADEEKKSAAGEASVTTARHLGDKRRELEMGRERRRGEGRNEEGEKRTRGEYL